MPRLSKGSPSENLELLQWLARHLAGASQLVHSAAHVAMHRRCQHTRHVFMRTAGLEPLPDYQPVLRRAAAMKDLPPDGEVPLPAACRVSLSHAFGSGR